jgi:hypothetical protein
MEPKKARVCLSEQWNRAKNGYGVWCIGTATAEKDGYVFIRDLNACTDQLIGVTGGWYSRSRVVFDD